MPQFTQRREGKREREENSSTRRKQEEKQMFCVEEEILVEGQRKNLKGTGERSNEIFIEMRHAIKCAS